VTVICDLNATECGACGISLDLRNPRGENGLVHPPESGQIVGIM
jgi:hypothetical protein